MNNISVNIHNMFRSKSTSDILKLAQLDAPILKRQTTSPSWGCNDLAPPELIRTGGTVRYLLNLNTLVFKLMASGAKSLENDEHNEHDNK